MHPLAMFFDPSVKKNKNKKPLLKKSVKAHAAAACTASMHHEKGSLAGQNQPASKQPAQHRCYLGRCWPQLRLPTLGHFAERLSASAGVFLGTKSCHTNMCHGYSSSRKCAPLHVCICQDAPIVYLNGRIWLNPYILDRVLGRLWIFPVRLM